MLRCSAPSSSVGAVARDAGASSVSIAAMNSTGFSRITDLEWQPAIVRSSCLSSLLTVSSPFSSLLFLCPRLSEL